jgi:hypothetical protein|eukprot:COSAG02_NODE_1528_length_12089_cov_21.637698_12_plen_98_part_00
MTNFGLFGCCLRVASQVLHYANSRVLVATRKHECRPKENCAGILGQTKADLSVNVNPFEVGTLRVPSRLVSCLRYPSYFFHAGFACLSLQFFGQTHF